VQRCGDDADGRITRVRLTAHGEQRLSQLAAAHLVELKRLAPILDHLAAEPAIPGTPLPGPPDRQAAAPARSHQPHPRASDPAWRLAGADRRKAVPAFRQLTEAGVTGTVDWR
jgi:hypothetical protein